LAKGWLLMRWTMAVLGIPLLLLFVAHHTRRRR
jgi:hypothetical protein